MGEALDLVHGRALAADRGELLMADLAAWVRDTLGHAPADPALFKRALTHSSRGDDHYERLEFLGDRVLGLSMATWLYELFPDEPEGELTKRFNELVSGTTCAEIARELGASAHLRLGKQARDDGAGDSDNVLGDIMESLIGALYLERGLDEAAAFVRRAWGDRVGTRDRAPKHPKSALQEWAAAKGRRPPAYQLVERSGPHHSPRFLVKVSIGNLGEAEAEGTSKQEAETEAARLLLERLCTP
jgi:ribonuclease III